MQKLFLGLVGILALLLAACGSGLNINVDENGNLGISVELAEDTVNSLIKNAIANGDNSGNVGNIFTEVTSVDMKPGMITVNGNRTGADGAAISGSFDLSLATDGGKLQARITAVNIPDLTLESPEVTKANEDLQQAFAQSASDSDQVQFNSVEITDTSLKFVITVLTATATPQ